MKSHPIAPVLAMALLLAILMWVCSSCEKPHKYIVLPCELGDTTIVAESNTTYIGYCDILVDSSNVKKVLDSLAVPVEIIKIKRDTSQIKFINIPPNQRTASLKHAEEGLIYWRTKYTPWKHHFEQNPLGAPHSTYRFNAAEAIYFFHEKEFKAEFYCYVGEQDGKEQRVIIDVTKEQWVKDIFNKFYNAKIK